MQPNLNGNRRHVQRIRRPAKIAAVGGMALASLVAACSSSATTSTRTATATATATSSSSPAAASTAHAVKLTTIAQFPAGVFLENLAVRTDGSILVTALNRYQLYYLPPYKGTPVQPLLLHTFAGPTTGIVETDPDVFYVTVSNLAKMESYLERVDLRGWQPGMPAPVQQVLHFPAGTQYLDGSCLLAPGVILEADATAGLIWRVDLSADGMSATASVWLKDPSMELDPNNHIPAQPGVNGVRYDAKSHDVYYTSTAQQLFMRERVDPTTFDAVLAPELVSHGSMWDDFAIDDSTGMAYATTHRQNTLERVPLDPDSGEAKQTVAGSPLDLQMVGPSAFAWGRNPGDYGSVGYVTTDGGNTAPPPGVGVTPAKVLRAEVS